MWYNKQRHITNAINDSDIVKSDTNIYYEGLAFVMGLIGLGVIYYYFFPEAETREWKEFSANMSIIYIFARMFLGEIISSLAVCLFLFVLIVPMFF